MTEATGRTVDNLPLIDSTKISLIIEIVCPVLCQVAIFQAIGQLTSVLTTSHVNSSISIIDISHTKFIKSNIKPSHLSY